MNYVEIVDGNGRRRRVGLDRPRMLIGREPTCDIYLPHPNVSRRHAQLQQTEQGTWVLQDLSSLNHVFVEDAPPGATRDEHSAGWRAVQQIVLEPGTRIRIAEYRLALAEGTPPDGDTGSTLVTPEPTEAWTGLEPGWLEQFQVFQRGLLRVEEPRHVLERLAAEFNRVAQPQQLAVGLGQGAKYQWEVVVGDPPTGRACLEEAGRRASSEDSDVRTWNNPAANGATEGPAAPLCLLFPIKGRSSILGHVFVLKPRFTPLPSAVQRYLTLLTTHAGLVWENFQLIALRLAQKEMEQELRQARQIQIDLFPPTFDVDPRLNAFAVNLPSVQVSGDYYDLFRTGPDTVAFVVADAMGHGMPAALMMAAVRASLRMGVSQGLAWEAVFQGLDGVITQARAGAYVTGILGEIDLAKGELRLVSAGHPPPSVLVAGAPVVLPGHSQTRPWGMDFESPWQLGRVGLGSDWSILCFTDGITEAAARHERGYGSRMVSDFHRHSAHLGAEDLCQGLLGAVSALQDPRAALGDDQTVLALRSVAGK
jgi:serine phosphatase RsbU (regulator of sigma subunit)